MCFPVGLRFGVKEEISPNEACYIEVDPIGPSALIPLNDSIAKQKAG